MEVRPLSHGPSLICSKVGQGTVNPPLLAWLVRFQHQALDIYLRNRYNTLNYNKGDIMDTMLEEVQQEETDQLNAHDRCDSCQAQVQILMVPLDI